MKIINAIHAVNTSLNKFDQELEVAHNKLTSKFLVKPLNSFTKEEMAEVEEIVNTIHTSIGKTRSELRRLRRPFFREMELMKELIIAQLESTKNSYYWAIETYSASNLSEFDEATREIIKQTLREYFEPKDLTYEGWVANV